ncbi:MAG: hypothetical protein ACSLFB_10905 [Acidimicrobiales bacterium]
MSDLTNPTSRNIELVADLNAQDDDGLGPADYVLADQGDLLGVVEAEELTVGPQAVLAKAFRGELVS